MKKKTQQDQWFSWGKTVVTFWACLITYEAFNGDYTIFGNRDLGIMEEYNWGIVAISLENTVCEGYT